MDTTVEGDRALSSVDGREWEQSGPIRESVWPVEPDPTVVKLVLGRLSGAKDGDDWSSVVDMLRSGIAERFPRLTHLHVWGLPIESLGPLPERLVELDLRKCVGLEGLPDLPSGLRTLDVSGCASLNAFPIMAPQGLRRLHVDDCPQLPPDLLNVFLRGCVEMEELTAANLTQLTGLVLPQQAPPDEGHPDLDAVFPSSRLKRVVLSGCSNLTTLPDLRGYRWLHHVNLNGCASLKALPNLPIGWTTDCVQDLGVRYFVAHGCDQLREFDGLDLRPIHLSTDAQDNVATGLRTMERLRGTPGNLTRAKLLILGSGRCGKTTIAKALQWVQVGETDAKAKRELDPRSPSKSTHGIEFWPWGTAFRRNESEEEDGHAHIWDFAGQDIYQNTHRLFVSQGTVFVIVTTSEEAHRRRVTAEADKMTGIPKAAFLQQNEYRDVGYWLDYVRSAIGLDDPRLLAASHHRVSVHIVYTECSDVSLATERLKEQAHEYRDLIGNGAIEVSVVDIRHGVDETTVIDQMQRLSRWVGLALWKAADASGRRVPAFYERVAEFCEQVLDNRAVISPTRFSFGDWVSRVERFADALPSTGLGERLGREQGAAVAQFLHRSGVVFKLPRITGDADVIVDQRWAARLIYALLTLELAGWLRTVSGRLIPDQGLKDRVQRELRHSSRTADERRAFYDYLDACNICVRVGGSWMAVQRELLPVKIEAHAADVRGLWNGAGSESSSMVSFSYAVHGKEHVLLGNSVYRDVLTHLIRNPASRSWATLFGDSDRTDDGLRVNYETDWRFWQDGFLVVVRREVSGRPSAGEPEHGAAPTEIALQVEWRPLRSGEQERFAGGLFVQLRAPRDQGFDERLEDVMTGNDGPLAWLKEEQRVRSDELVSDLGGQRGSGGVREWTSEDGPRRKDLRYDVAISYRGRQRDLAKRLGQALTEAKIDHHFDYALDDRDSLRGQDGGSRLTDIYDYLKHARVLVVIASGDYFETPDLASESNLYAPVELAEAVLAFGGYSEADRTAMGEEERNRPAARFLWLAVGVSRHKIEASTRAVIPLHNTNVCNQRTGGDICSADLTPIDEREINAIRGCSSRMVTDFLSAVGRNNQQKIDVGDGDSWVTAIVDRIRRALDDA